jgi:hypothetical protein
MLSIKYTFLVMTLGIVAGNISAQQKSPVKRWQFHSINAVGLLEGQAGSAFQLQSINGVQYESWIAAVGLGLDFYRYRTIPLHIDLRKEFGKANNKFFVYADAGINFYWQRDKDAKQFYYNDKFKNGLYSEVGAGYKIKISQESSVLFSAGFSYKKITEQGNSYWYNPGYQGPAYTLEKINYNLTRLVLKAAIEL